MVGTTLSHYKILEHLGSGGQGVVYKAEDTRLKRTVALKFLPPESTRDLHAKERFMREAQAASALQHNNICTVHDIADTDDGRMFIVMDCYEGGTLDERLERRPLTSAEVYGIASQIARGMIVAHERGIIHRDLKPANIFVTREGVVKVFDFGLAKLLGSQAITREGRTAGTVLYMSPEQLRGEEVDLRTDIWSFGVILYRMLTGRLPFEADYEQAVVYKIMSEPPTPIAAIAPEAPPLLAAAAERCLRKDPASRPQSMAEVLDLLEDENVPALPANGRSWKSIPWRNILIASVIVGIVGGLFYFGIDRLFPPLVTRSVPRLAVLLFANQTNNQEIDNFRPEIQNRFVRTLVSARGLTIEDGPRINDIIRERFSSDNPPRTDDLYRFLRGRGYEYVVEGTISRSSSEEYSLQVTCKNTHEYTRVLETFNKPLVPKEQLTGGSGEISEEVLAYLNIKVLNVKPEMGVWESGHRYENWAAVAQLDRAYEATLKGDGRGATASLKKAIELDSEFISPRIWVAPALDGNPEESRSNLEVLRRLRPTADEFEQSMIDWVEAYTEHAYGREVACLTRALKNDPDNRILLSNLAAGYAGWGDTTRAIAVYDRLVKSRWQFPAIYISALRYIFRQRNYSAAEEVLLRWRGVDTTDNSSMLFGWLAAMYALHGDSSEAESCRMSFDSLCVIKGHDRDLIQYLLGSCYADFGILGQSENLLRSAISKESRRPEYHERLGDVLVARHDTVAAIEAYRVALSLAPAAKSAQFAKLIHLKMGDLSRERGDFRGMRDYYMKFLSRDSTSGESKRVQQWMSVSRQPR